MTQRMQKRKIAIFDLDGTLSNPEHRIHLVRDSDTPNWDEFYRQSAMDKPVVGTIILARALVYAGIHVWIWSGRNEMVKTETRDWLNTHNVVFHDLLMRPLKDYRPDVELKKQWLDELSDEDRSSIFFAIDDRQRNVELFRSYDIDAALISEVL